MPMRDQYQLSGTGLILAAVSAVVLLYFPWGGVLHTGVAVPEHLGWGLFGGGFVLMSLTCQTAVYRSRLLIAGGILLTLPLLWIPDQADVWRALTRVAALWGGGVLLAGLAGRQMKDNGVHLLVCLVMLTGVPCALSVLFRVFFPGIFHQWLPWIGGGWASGGYLQPDLMALWLAVSVVAGLHLWLFKRWVIVLPTMLLLTVALVLTFRLAGMMSVALACALMLLVTGLGLRRRLLGGIALLCLSGVGAWLVMSRVLGRPVELAWPTELVMLPLLLRAGMALLLAHPFTGTGYGHFAASLPDGIRMAGLSDRWHPGFVAEHPGSELLYWTTEGGLLALAGIVLLLVWGVRLLFMLWRQAVRSGGYGQRGSEGVGLLFCALPLLLTTLVAGMPWYQSPLHYLLFIVLIGAAAAWLSEPEVTGKPSRPMGGLLRVLLCIAGLAVLWFAVTGTRVAMTLQDARQSGGKDVSALVAARRLNPLYLPDDVNFALTMHQLQQFNQSGDKALLAGTEPFFQDYLTRHPDPNVYSLYITVLDKQGKSEEAERVYQEGQHRVPWDRRFTPDPPVHAESPPHQEGNYSGETER